MIRRSSQRRFVILLAAIAAASLVACTRSKQQVAAEHAATVTRYCADCHSAAERDGELVLERPDLANPAAQRAKWEKVVHKLSAGLMPPPGEPGRTIAPSRTSYLISRRSSTRGHRSRRAQLCAA